ncbi:MAG: glucose-6-phosphate isomerase [Nitrospinae bacterium]|nr:glucose-6-phosphate isomerase [Nitrospinota bacterium]
MDIVLDYTNALTAAIGGENGISVENIRALETAGGRVHAELAIKRRDGKLPFYDLPGKTAGAKEIVKAAARLRKDFDTMVVLGIGGSALGTTALVSALRHSFHNSISAKKRGGMKIFVVDNIDPDQFSDLLSTLKLGETVFNVISKSGSTAETMSQFMIALNLLKKKFGKKDWRKHIVITTDAKSGILRKIADDNKLKSFLVPDGVGGRFTVLTPVSLLPAACAGIDIVKLLKGAARMDLRCREASIMKNPAYLFAAVHYLLDTSKAKKMTVMMPYSSKLYYVADWFRQLWAESLGKKTDVDGRPVHVGQTPIKALGATDQHSQVQLYVEGPFDKVVCFLEVGRFENTVAIPAEYPDVDDLSYLGGSSLNELLNVEKRGTEYALTANGRPNITIKLPDTSPDSLGQLLYMLEVATAFAGGLYRINAFDQPGVEFGKNYAYAMMGRKGHEERRREFESRGSGERKTV